MYKKRSSANGTSFTGILGTSTNYFAAAVVGTVVAVHRLAAGYGAETSAH